MCVIVYVRMVCARVFGCVRVSISACEEVVRPIIMLHKSTGSECGSTRRNRSKLLLEPLHAAPRSVTSLSDTAHPKGEMCTYASGVERSVSAESGDCFNLRE